MRKDCRKMESTNTEMKMQYILDENKMNEISQVLTDRQKMI